MFGIFNPSAGGQVFRKQKAFLAPVESKEQKFWGGLKFNSNQPTSDGGLQEEQ
jgi:hypothetical protein